MQKKVQQHRAYEIKDSTNLFEEFKLPTIKIRTLENMLSNKLLTLFSNKHKSIDKDNILKKDLEDFKNEIRDIFSNEYEKLVKKYSGPKEVVTYVTFDEKAKYKSPTESPINAEMNIINNNKKTYLRVFLPVELVNKLLLNEIEKDLDVVIRYIVGAFCHECIHFIQFWTNLESKKDQIVDPLPVMNFRNKYLEYLAVPHESQAWAYNSASELQFAYKNIKTIKKLLDAEKWSMLSKNSPSFKNVLQSKEKDPKKFALVWNIYINHVKKILDSNYNK